MGSLGYVRPDWVRRLNAMAVGAGGARAIVPLDADEIMGTASAGVGLDDFGEPTWEEPYRRLIESLEDEAELNVVGRLQCRHDLLRHLSTRLQIIEAVRVDPSISEEHIVAPVVVTGPARSGTSILHELLACDPGLRAPRAWEMAHPLPPPSDEDRARRIAAAESEFDLWGDVQPEFLAVHEMKSTLPEECIWLMAPELDMTYWATCVNVPTFLMWRAQTDAVPVYRFHRRFLQTLQHGTTSRPWVLKSPVHMGRLPALLAVYPDARVILTHRDPVRTLPSTVSTVASGRWLRSDAVDTDGMAAGMTFSLQMMLGALPAACAAVPAGQLTHLHYVDLLDDPVQAIGRAYDELGIPRPTGHAELISDYLDARPQTKYGVHRYGLGDFGFDEAVIRSEFAPYTEAFGVAAEKAV